MHSWTVGNLLSAAWAFFQPEGSPGSCFFKISGVVYYKMRSEYLYFYLIYQVFLSKLRVVEVEQNKNRILLFAYQDWHIGCKIEYIWNCRCGIALYLSKKRVKDLWVQNSCWIARIKETQVRKMQNQTALLATLISLSYIIPEEVHSSSKVPFLKFSCGSSSQFFACFT